VFEETWAGKSRDYQDYIVVEKLRFQNVLHSHINKKLALSNSSSLKSVFEKPRFRDGLVWTVGQTVEIKLRFQIFPA